MYQLFRPKDTLSSFIDNYWAVTASEDNPADLAVEVFADARADLIFNFGVPYQRTRYGRPSVTIAQSNLDAHRSYPIAISQKGSVHIVGVRFHAGGLSAFSDLQMKRLSNRVVPIEEVFGPAVLELESSLGSCLDAAKLNLDDFFRNRLQDSKSFQSFWEIKESIEKQGGKITVEELCQIHYVTIRQIDRLFSKHLGFSPKTFARITRFQSVLSALKDSPAANMAEVAACCGYCDHSHLIRDFRTFGGAVPGGYKGYFPSDGPTDFSPNVVQFFQDS